MPSSRRLYRVLSCRMKDVISALVSSARTTPDFLARTPWTHGRRKFLAALPWFPRRPDSGALSTSQTGDFCNHYATGITRNWSFWTAGFAEFEWWRSACLSAYHRPGDSHWLACHAFGAKKKSASYVIVITQLFGAGIYLVKVSVSVARP